MEARRLHTTDHSRINTKLTYAIRSLERACWHVMSQFDRLTQNVTTDDTTLVILQVE